MFYLRVSPKFTKLKLYPTVPFPSESVNNISTISLNNSTGILKDLLFYHQHKSSSFLSLHFCSAKAQTRRLFPLHQSKLKLFLQSIVHIQLLPLSLSSQVQPTWSFLGLSSHGPQSMVPCNVGLFFSYFTRVNFISLSGLQAGTVSFPLSTPGHSRSSTDPTGGADTDSLIYLARGRNPSTTSSSSR